jgi:hypothetical protein
MEAFYFGIHSHLNDLQRIMVSNWLFIVLSVVPPFKILNHVILNPFVSNITPYIKIIFLFYQLVQEIKSLNFIMNDILIVSQKNPPNHA